MKTYNVNAARSLRPEHQTTLRQSQHPTRPQGSGQLQQLQALSLPQFDGRYRIDEVLSETTMSRVYLAFDQVRRESAIIKLGICGTEGAYINKEAEVLRLDLSPSFPRLLGSGVFEGHHYIAMELIRGTTLRALLNGRERLPLHRCLEFALQIAQALAPLHAAGDIHVDLKPENVMLAGGQVRVIDFGLACAIGTRYPNSIPGTPDYLSPEQARYRPLDQRADIYSLGLIMYEMLAGNNPMYDPSIAQTINNQANKPVPRLEREAIAERIRPEHRETMAEQIDQAHRLLREIISLLTAKEREDRAGDTAEVVELLRQAQRLAGKLAPYEIPIEEQTE